jgi:hypothetical protein
VILAPRLIVDPGRPKMTIDILLILTLVSFTVSLEEMVGPHSELSLLL